MPFELTKTPSNFMRLMNHVLHALIGKYMVIYFNDILIHSKFFVEYVSHLRFVLEILRKEKLYANLKKCCFCMDKLFFISFCC